LSVKSKKKYNKNQKKNMWKIKISGFIKLKNQKIKRKKRVILKNTIEMQLARIIQNPIEKMGIRHTETEFVNTR